MPKYQSRKSLSFVPVMAVLLLLGSMQFLQAEPTAVVIRAEDVTDTSFWRIDYFDTTADAVGDPIAEFDTHPVPVTPLDDFEPSSLRMEPGPRTGGSGCARLGGKAYFGTQALAGLKLSDLDKLSYSFLIEQGPLSGPQHFAIVVNIFVDKNGDGLWRGGDDSILVYEPLYTYQSYTPPISTFALNTWYANNPIGENADGRWHVAGQPLPGINTGSPLAPNDLWSEIIALPFNGATIGDLKIANPEPGCNGTTAVEGTGSGFNINIGQKSGDGFNNMITYLDRVILATSGGGALDIAETVYDLSAEPVPVTPTPETPTPETPTPETPTPETPTPETPTPETPTPETPTPETPTPETPVPTEVPATELLLNGGFETADSKDKNVPANWQVKNSTGDKLKCDKPEKKVAYEGSCMFQFKSGAGENSKLQQNVDLTANALNAGDTLNLAGFVFAKGDVNAKVMVKVIYTNDNEDKGKIVANVTTAAPEYAPLTGELSLNVVEQVKKIKVIVSNKGTKGKVRFDALTLTKSAASAALLPLPLP